jgi:excisionase family DNA binding protein
MAESPIYGLQPGEISWQEVCRQLRIARPTLYEAVKLKQIPVVRRGRTIRFRQDLLDRFLAGELVPYRGDGRSSEWVEPGPGSRRWATGAGACELSEPRSMYRRRIARVAEAARLLG